MPFIVSLVVDLMKIVTCIFCTTSGNQFHIVDIGMKIECLLLLLVLVLVLCCCNIYVVACLAKTKKDNHKRYSQDKIYLYPNGVGRRHSKLFFPFYHVGTTWYSIFRWLYSLFTWVEISFGERFKTKQTERMLRSRRW